MLVRFMLTSFNLVTILHAEANRLFQYVQIDVADRFELDAITGHAGLADRLSVSLREMPFICNAEQVNRNPCLVATDPDPEPFPRLAIRITQYLRAVPDGRIGDDFTLLVLSVVIPQLAVWIDR